MVAEEGRVVFRGVEMVWEECVARLQDELSPEVFNTWIRPLRARYGEGESHLRLIAPNRYVREEVQTRYLARIEELIDLYSDAASPMVVELSETNRVRSAQPARSGRLTATEALNPGFTFETFVEGKSNEMAKAAALQVANNTGKSYNPLLLYGGTGLGKTHLMQAVGNEALRQRSRARVVYIHSQQFVQEMVKAIREGTIQDFTQHYRTLEILLIDDVQFFANKVQSQDQFFHIFNALSEPGRQMVLTCDRYPRDVEGLEERLKSRFVWGLTVEVEPPELETRVAILLRKAEAEGFELDDEVAFFIAERIRSNVRELEGALRLVHANAVFDGVRITTEQVSSVLKRILAIHARQITIDEIQRVVAEHYRVTVSDILSKRRSRTLVRPRHVAMYLAKVLTNHSLPEIGKSFGDRDHTTVLHACNKIREAKDSNVELAEDCRNLERLLTT